MHVQWAIDDALRDGVPLALISEVLTAKALDLSIPRSILVRAEQVIE